MADAVLSFLAPPPLSPLFQAGGPFEGYNEDIVLISFFLVALAVVDFCVVKRVLVPGARYWALHAAINAVSAYAAFPDVWRALSDPIHAVSGPSHTMVANSAIAAIHIYHCLAFKLRSDEIMHHAVFVVILCGLAIPFKQVGLACRLCCMCTSHADNCALSCAPTTGWWYCKQLWMLLPVWLAWRHGLRHADAGEAGNDAWAHGEVLQHVDQHVPART